MIRPLDCLKPEDIKKIIEIEENLNKSEKIWEKSKFQDLFTKEEHRELKKRAKRLEKPFKAVLDKEILETYGTDDRIIGEWKHKITGEIIDIKNTYATFVNIYRPEINEYEQVSTKHFLENYEWIGQK